MSVAVSLSPTAWLFYHIFSFLSIPFFNFFEKYFSFRILVGVIALIFKVLLCFVVFGDFGVVLLFIISGNLIKKIKEKI